MSKVETFDPTTSKKLASYEQMSRDKAFELVDAAHEAFLDWRDESFEYRAGILHRIAGALRDHSDELARLMTCEMGKLLSAGKDEVALCAALFDYAAEHGPEALADQPRDLGDGKSGLVTFQPIGVIYSIQPWNFPLYQPVRVLAATLMAGNACVLKHASICTGSALRLREICVDAGLPEHLFGVLIIDHDISDEIIDHPKIRGVTLTGSDGAGRHVAAKAGAALKKTVLELGSNDAYLVLEDADVDEAVSLSVQGRLYNNGQTCVNAKRFIVTEAVYDRFVDGFTAAMGAIRMGDPAQPETELGPMSSFEQRETVDGQVRESLEKGATLLCGGEIPDGEGAFYPATVLGDVTPGMPAYDDEIFGPVASVIRARDDEDAMRIANDSRYGLGGGIFSRDVERARELARTRFDTGMVRINGFGAAHPNMPFGGVKDSGYGREHGGFGLHEFVNAKAVYLP
ncbi:NAD-dependent succinate-semialdehyde dehydrogenase [Poseidonocella sedimentorum]|uniref:Succinate-semialdehyde dehydrogenase / glutarate-semialdehyde dehydrogenase n=1 Tax=Poseidonocella sedimentorum TaxID=871652 RepID=A0A1I6DIA9_9RHOB|nr:NAD-dependent succinate-semialdehyde dehydrogenase [Poseidonocella sedimentorum]SFR05174.1 succinate-semialdehyde dehydrogenase / glutarate-semialdehyde dehydrogenase [Poseidonocella sedimentorum]